LVLPRTPPLLETDYLRRLRDSFRSRDLQVAAYSEQYRISTGLANAIIEAATAEGIDPDLAFRLVRVESVFKERAVSSAGALGLTQLMPGTARLLDRSLRSRSAILEPQTNLRLGFRYLRHMIKQYDGDVRLALLAYNRGPNAVNRALRGGQDPENGYSHKVLGTWGGNPYRGEGLLTR
jgi:soluble lytic murein transglycosylase-like protein